MFPWNKTDKTPTFNDNPTHVTRLTMLEAIRTSQDGMVDDVLGILLHSWGREEHLAVLVRRWFIRCLKTMWNKAEYVLKDSQKAAGQLEECYDPKGMQSLLNGRNFKYHFLGRWFHILPQSYKFYHGLCLNNLLQVLFIVNQRY